MNAATWQVLRCTWLQLRASVLPLLAGGLVLTVLTPILLSWLSAAHLPSLAQSATFVLHVLLAVVGFMLASELQKQNQPALARLAPGHVQRLRTVQVGSWLALSLAHVIPHTHSAGPALIALGLGAWLQAMLMTMVGARVRVWLPVLTVSLGVMAPVALALVQTAEAGTSPSWLPAALTLAGCAVAALAAFGLSSLIRTGNTVHREHYANLQALINLKALTGEARGQVILKPGVVRLMETVYRRVWRQLLSAPTPANSMARFGLLAIKQVHWARQVLTIAVLATVLIAPQLPGFLAAVSGGTLDAWMVSNSGYVAFGFLLMGIGWLNDGVDLRAGRQEHALLVLLPGLPPAAQMARAWLIYRLRDFLITWACSWGAALLLVAATGPQWLGHVALLASLGLGFSFALAGNWAVAGGSHKRKDWLLLLPVGLMGLMGLLVCLGLPPGAAAALVLVSIAAGWAWIWPRIGRRPSPFPAGRLEA
ncbi:MAG: hypothetical protein ACK5O3_09930 [Burkholderiales bacterium]